MIIHDRVPTECALMPLEAYSDLAGAVDVRAVFDGDDGDKALIIVYAVNYPVVAPAGAVHSLQAELQGLANPVRVFSQGAIEELDDRGRDFLREPGKARRAGLVQAMVNVAPVTGQKPGAWRRLCSVRSPGQC